ncbi:MAG: XrtY-associated glycosyltransferase XYAG1, partial [Thermoflexibacteraceae bacterium]
MKILHIIPSYKPAFIYGGTTVSVSALCENLAKAGHDLTVYTTTANGTTELPLYNQTAAVLEGVKVFYFRRITKDHTHFSPELLINLWKNAKKFEAVHIHSWWNLVAVFATLICWLKGIKPILAPRGMLSEYSFTHENSLKKQLIHTFLGKFLLSKTILHATASQELQEGQRIIPMWKGFILPNILQLPTQKNNNLPPTTTENFTILFLSRIDKKKGIEILLEALQQTTIPFHLDIIGSGEENYIQYLKDLAAKRQIDHKITWHGRIEGDLRYDLYAKADVFVLPSYNENFANVVIEALSVGTPVIVSNRVGLADYVNQQQMGEVINLSADELQKALEKLYEENLGQSSSPK